MTFINRTSFTLIIASVMSLAGCAPMERVARPTLDQVRLGDARGQVAEDTKLLAGEVRGEVDRIDRSRREISVIGDDGLTLEDTGAARMLTLRDAGNTILAEVPGASVVSLTGSRITPGNAGFAAPVAGAVVFYPGCKALLKAPFKVDVRKFKEMGLTESLDVGYRLSPRGRAVLARLDRSGAGD